MAQVGVKMKIKKVNYGLIHCIAHCLDCGFMAELYTTAQKEARKHAEVTGHKVAVEVGNHYTVEGIKK